MIEFEKRESIEGMLKNGLSYAEIAEKLNLTYQYVYNLAKKRFPEECKKRQAEKEKVKEKLENEISKLLKKGMSYQKMSEVLNISPTTAAKFAKKISREEYEKRMRGTSTTNKYDVKSSDTLRYQQAIKHKNFIETLKDKIKIGQKITLGKRKGVVVEKYRHHFIVKMDRGYKESFIYSDLVEKEA